MKEKFDIEEFMHDNYGFDRVLSKYPEEFRGL